MDPQMNEAPADPTPPADDLAAIDAIGQEFAEQFAKEDAEAPAPALEADSPEAPAPQPAEGTEATPEPAADETVEKIVAREVELRQREEAVKARETEMNTRVAAAEARVKELEAQVASIPTDFVESLGSSPTETLRAAGYDPQHIVRLMLAEDLARQGKPIPMELEIQIVKAQQQMTARKHEQTLRQYQEQQAAAAFVAQVERGATEYLKNVEGISKYAPTVAEVAKANPTRVYDEIMDVIASDAAAKAGKDPSAKVLSYEEAAKRVEARWAELRKFFGPPAASTNPPAKASTTVAPPPAKPPAKPLTRPATPKSYDELLEEAIAAGVSEYRRNPTQQ